MNTEDRHPDLLSLTAEIVAAHVSNNTVDTGELPALIEKVHRTLATLGGSAASGARSMAGILAAQGLQPAVPVKKSVTPDYLICLEDGKKMKMLKRHLKTAYNLTPDEYRAKWGLPSDYPMTAPNYAIKRSSLAREIGLGKTHSKGRK